MLASFLVALCLTFGAVPLPELGPHPFVYSARLVSPVYHSVSAFSLLGLQVHIGVPSFCRVC